jgi:DNA-binding response OmpR family regulator
MGVALLTADLVVASRVEGAAAKAGMGFRTIGSAAELAAELERERLNIVLIDLSTPSLDVGAVMDGVRAMGGERPAVVAFGPHVHESRLVAARAAGCDEVLSRGQFFAQIDAILRRASGHQGEVSRV